MKNALLLMLCIGFFSHHGFGGDLSQFSGYWDGMCMPQIGSDAIAYPNTLEITCLGYECSGISHQRGLLKSFKIHNIQNDISIEEDRHLDTSGNLDFHQTITQVTDTSQSLLVIRQVTNRLYGSGSTVNASITEVSLEMKNQQLIVHLLSGVNEGTTCTLDQRTE